MRDKKVTVKTSYSSAYGNGMYEACGRNVAPENSKKAPACK